MRTTSQTIVLCGDSVVMSSIGATCRRAGLEIMSLDTNQADPAEQLQRLAPGVILYDLAHPPADFVLKSLTQDPKRLLIGIDLDRDCMLVLSGKQERAVTTTDLVRMIETWQDSTHQQTLWQTHLDRLWQFITDRLAALGARPRQQKLVFAFATITICGVLAFLLSLVNPQANVPLTGTAVGRYAPELGLTFAGGILVGALLLGLAMGWARHRFPWNIRDKK
jgi:hypothetical protein